MIEVKSAKKVQTPGKERLTAMEGLRQTVMAIPKRKIGMAMMALFGLVAYIKTVLGGSEVAAQSAPDTPLGADDTAAPICETDNSAADNSGRVSYGNAELFQASARNDAQDAALTSPQPSLSSVLSTASSGLQLQRLDASGLQPAPLNFQPISAGPGPNGSATTDPVTPPPGGSGGAGAGAGGDGDAGAGGGDMTPTDPDDNDDNDGTPQDPLPPVTPPAEHCKDDAPCDAGDAGPCDTEPCAHDTAEGEPCEASSSDCAAPSRCDADEDCAASDDCDKDQGCDPFAGVDADCFDDPLMAIRDITFGLSTADDFSGTDADDLIDAGDGADTVLGGASDDLLIGAAGDDILTGSTGNDRLAGGQGADTVDGGAGDDILTGGAGADVLWDGTGADRLFGDAGNDTIYLAVDDASDVIDGGAGIDTLDLSDGGQSAHIDIAAGTITRSDLPQDSFTGIEIFTAGTGEELFDLSGFFSPGASAMPETVFQIRDFGHDDTLVLTDDVHIALSDLHAVTDTRKIHDDTSEFEARISVFDPETVALSHGRAGFRQDDEDALMIRRIELSHETETGHIAFELWITGPEHDPLRNPDPSQDFTS